MELHLKIKNPEGLHARPAGILAKKASEFQSSVQIKTAGQQKNAKSIMSLLSLGMKKDQEFTLLIEGPDANEASLALQTLVENEFKA